MRMKSTLLILAIGFSMSADTTAGLAQPGKDSTSSRMPAYLDTSLTFEARAADLVSRMTLDERISQMQNSAPAIPRLGVAQYNWWNECLHGVARNGIATVFPQAIGMAATWDTDLIHAEADVISTEARAKYNEAVSEGKHEIYQGLTFWSPNINIFRDPRWGRGQETYGEDPFLTSKIGVAFVKGLQGDDPKYLKVVSTPKHFAVHSGPEPLRHTFDARTGVRDLFETYLPAFRACVIDGGAFSVMGAYSAYDGVPCCASKFLLTDLLRDRWGFGGYVVSDCGAISDIYSGHKYAANLASAAALAVKAGCDLSCGGEYSSLKDAVSEGLITEQQIDVSVERLMLARMRLGMFDPPGAVPFNKISPSENDTESHRLLSRRVADESMVLLKNADNTLPFSKNLKRVAVVGLYADDVEVLLGNYHGTPSKPVTILDGIKNKLGAGVDVEFAAGYELPGDTLGPGEDALVRDATALALRTEVTIVVAGISPKLEGEEMAIDLPGFKGGDRTSLDLPAGEEKLLKALAKTGKPVVLVLTGGSAVAVNWEEKNLPAIIDAWYPGEEGGDAVADVLFGDYDPAGRLPVTFYKSVKDVPPFEDYDMSGRTYRYFKGSALYPFGFGLSYTRFEYSGITVDKQSAKRADTLDVSVKIRNTGKFDGDEVVQLYVRNLTSKQLQPIRSLEGFKRVFVAKGESTIVHINFPVSSLGYFNAKVGDYYVEPGRYEVEAASSSGDIRLKKTIDVE